MKELTDDFLKRYGGDESGAKYISYGFPLVLFGCRNICAVRLSMGARVCYRKRSDDRVIIQNTASDRKISFNLNQLDNITLPQKASDIIKAAAASGGGVTGCEMLIHTDVEEELFPLEMILGAAAVMEKPESVSPISLARACFDSSKMRTAAVSAVVGSAAVSEDLVYRELPVTFDGFKVVMTLMKKGRLSKNEEWQLSEEKRFQKAEKAMQDGDTEAIFSLMNSTDADGRVGDLLEIARLRCEASRPLIRNCGIVSIVKNSMVDEFVETVNDLFERKCGIMPDFYICDAV